MASSRTRCAEILKQNLLVLLVLIGSVVGIGIGIGIRNSEPSDSVLIWIGILGEVYMNMLKMMLVPLVVSTIITGTASLHPKSNGKIGLFSFGYLMASNFVGALLGAVLCVLLKPGKLSEHAEIHASTMTSLKTEDIFADLLRNVFPDNLLSATFQKTQTTYSTENIIMNKTINGTEFGAMKTVVSGKKLSFVHSSNILGLLVASTLFGIGAAALKDKGKPFIDFFSSTTEIVLFVLGKLIWFTPIGVCSLIAKTVGSTKNLEQDISRLGFYLLTVIIGCAIVMFILAPICYFVIEKKNPFKFFFTLINAYMITIATTMSVLAIPEIIRHVEGDYNIDKRIVRFTASISAAIGRCGSVLYISVSCLFIMQFTNQNINAMSVILVIILSTVFSLAIPSISGASLITVIILLTALSIPPESAALLFTFEWILDRIRSCANVSTHVLCPVLINRTCKSAVDRNENKYTEAHKDNGFYIENDDETNQELLQDHLV